MARARVETAITWVFQRRGLLLRAHVLLTSMVLLYVFVRSGRFTGYTPPPKSAAYADAVQRGRSVAAEKVAIFGGLTRNGASTLGRAIELMRDSGALFRDFRIVVFENDSDDGTDTLLFELAAADARVVGLSERLAVGPALEHGGFHRTRFERMAGFRRRLLQRMEEEAAASFAGQDVVFVMADLDLRYGWTPDALATTFAHPDAEWDVVCANGVVNDAQHWDTLALRTARFNDTRRKAQLDAAHIRFPLRPGLVSVRSCFGGVAVYKPAAFCGCRYPPGDDCEHVLLHDCMRARARARIFVNPVFLVRYGVYLPLIMAPPVTAAAVAYLVLASAALCAASRHARAGGARRRLE